MFLDEFPVTGSGKVQKFVLRERWGRGEFQFIDAHLLVAPADALRRC